MPGFIRPTLLLLIGLVLSAPGVPAAEKDWKCAPDPKTGHWNCGSDHPAQADGRIVELGEEGKRLTQVSTYRGAADISGSRGDDECRSLLGRASEHL